MSVTTYDPKLFSIIIAAIPLPAKGYADGEFIRLERDSDAYTDVAGTDGSVTRARQHDKRATFTLTVMQKSVLNSILSALHNADLNSDAGAGVGVFALKDRSGTTVHAGSSCWIAKMPDVTGDKNPTSRAWKIRVADLESFEGE